MTHDIDDLRITGLAPLIPPAILMEEIPASSQATDTVYAARQEIAQAVAGADDRLVVVVGPCSIHDPDAALDYASKLAEERSRLADDLIIVMRVYFEKPRTTVGWKGLINDPNLDGSFKINQGLRRARTLLLQLAEQGMPAGTEFLDTISPQFYADLISWGAIGARTTECQLHRELASGLSMPVGFKNGTRGGVQIAVDAIKAAANPHHFLSVTKQGLSAIVGTAGNEHCHIILRGGGDGPNFEADHVVAATALAEKAGISNSLMIDCSHGNSNKDHSRQPLVAANIAEQISGGSKAICGVMIESHLVGGNQKCTDPSTLTYGQSITDACLGWDETIPVLEQLARAVAARRKS